MEQSVALMSLTVSIVTASFNQGKYIGQCIDSVRDQSYRPIEHIIHDNCSTDLTRQLLDEYAANPNGVETKIIRAPDQGQTDALNRGFRMTTGDIVGWLNADDYYLPGAISRVVEQFSGDDQTDVLYGDFILVDENGRVLQTRREIGFDPHIMLYIGCYVPSTATFFRRRMFGEGFYLDTDFDYIMDGEFFLRLHRAGKTFKHIRSYLAGFRRHSEQKSLNADGRARERRILHDRYGLKLFQSDRLNHILHGIAIGVFLPKRVFLKLIGGCYF